MSTRSLTCLAAVLIAVTARLSGQQPLPSHTLLGKVSDTNGTSLPGLTVELSNPASTDSVRTAVTGADGRYRFERVVPGVYVLAFRLPGFVPVLRDLEIGSGSEDFEFDAKMQPLAAGTLSLPSPAGPQRRVVCGLTMMTPPRNPDPKIVVPNPQPNGARPATPTMRTVQPTMCWDPVPLAPSVPAR
jgi:hypothetical protein